MSLRSRMMNAYKKHKFLIIVLVAILIYIIGFGSVLATVKYFSFPSMHYRDFNYMVFLDERDYAEEIISAEYGDSTKILALEHFIDYSYIFFNDCFKNKSDYKSISLTHSRLAALYESAENVYSATEHSSKAVQVKSDEYMESACEGLKARRALLVDRSTSISNRLYFDELNSELSVLMRLITNAAIGGINITDHE